MVDTLRSYLSGQFVAGKGTAAPLLNPATEETVAAVADCSAAIGPALEFARDRGARSLRALSFAQRGALLKQLAERIHENRDALIECGVVNAGNTRSDAKFDVDGAAGVLAHYGELGEKLGEGTWRKDGDAIALSSGGKLAGRHVRVPIDGVAVLINAYNFPAWGMMEKAAAAWLAGVPVLVKPATATALMAARLVEDVAGSGILPEGALSFLVGPTGALLESLDERDAVAFTGSSETAAWIRSLDGFRLRSIRLNVEADSLNAAVLGPDVEAGSETFDLFVNDVYRDLTQKAGQKCTAIRRVFVPESAAEAVKDALIQRLSDTRVGDPSVDGIRVGPLATAAARKTVLAGIEKLSAQASLAHRVPDEFAARPGFEGKGFFVAPRLLEVARGQDAPAVHSIEVFGPCATLLPYADEAAMFAAVKSAGGGLVASIYTDDRRFLKDAVTALAAAHGRLFLGSKRTTGGPGPGTAMPQLKHGGPGRAGGGDELGGLAALDFYTHRVALQGYGPLVDWLAG